MTTYTFESPVGPDDIVYIVRDASISTVTECPCCGGKRGLILGRDGETYPCPYTTCKEGSITSYTAKRMILEATVRALCYSAHEGFSAISVVVTWIERGDKVLSRKFDLDRVYLKYVDAALALKA